MNMSPWCGLAAVLLPCAAFPQALPAMLESALSSVVTVAIYKADHTKQVLGFRGNQELAYARSLDLANAVSSGSGFVINVDGRTYVATNAHVIENAMDEEGSVHVYSIDRTRYEVKVRGGDSFYDFALLEPVEPFGPEVTAMAFAKDAPHVGERVFAIGNPLGEYPYTVTDGIISARNRVRGGLTGKFGFLQSTATVIWGNSGGPLIDERGGVVGMNSQIAFAHRGGDAIWQPQINFALEASICQRLTRDILANKGRVRRCYLGVEICQVREAAIDPATGTSKYVLSDPKPRLMAVNGDAPGRAVLDRFVGAFILAVNGEEVRNLEEVFGELERTLPGDTVAMTFLDAGRTNTVRVPTTELATGHLEGLAQRFVTGDGSARLSTTGQQVFLEMEASGMTARHKGPVVADRTVLGIIGIGSVAQNGQDHDLWRVNSIADMGTALRLHGLAGYCDLVCSDAQDREAGPRAVRIFLSGKRNVLRSTLWY